MWLFIYIVLVIDIAVDIHITVIICTPVVINIDVVIYIAVVVWIIVGIYITDILLASKHQLPHRAYLSFTCFHLNYSVHYTNDYELKILCLDVYLLVATQHKGFSKMKILLKVWPVCYFLVGLIHIRALPPYV